MRECQLKNAGGKCKKHGAVCLSCDHYTDRQSGILVTHPGSAQNDNGISDLGVRHQTFRKIKR